MNILLSKNDHIIVHTPCYQSLTEVAISIGCEVTQWMADEDNSWKLKLDFLKKGYWHAPVKITDRNRRGAQSLKFINSD